jgi:hypothetical protein
MSHLKVINASRGSIHKYENLKRKLHNCNANIYFNQQCLKKQLTPKYALIRVPNTSPASKYTQRKISHLRIKDEIKFLHAKKQHLNHQIYLLHLQLANSWNNSWPYIQHTIEEKLQRETQTKYKNLDNKLNKLTKEQTTTPREKHTFHPRVINNTNITFSDNEMELLQKGPKFNLHSKKKNWLQNLALEAETAVTLLPTTDRDVYRKLIADRIDTLQNHNTTQLKTKKHPEANTINSIQTKLKENQAMITTADKGNSLVILPIQTYESKIQEFLSGNNFQTTTTDPTKAFQAQIRRTINASKTLIPRDIKWKHINLNPSPPTIKGLIKIHKTTQPIRPVVNWRNAPAYKLAKLFTQKIHQLTPLPYSFNVKNTKELILQLKDTTIQPHFTLASLDITNMYSNIPVAETREILSSIMKNNLLDSQTQQELLSWYDIITKQNYFSNNNDIVIQNEGLAMGAPSSGLIAEIFLQHTEYTHLAHITRKHNIINYFRYVDDILLIFDPHHTDIQAILVDFNTIHPTLHFTAETENDNHINYLDISIHRTPTGLKTSIYRKPTFTDTIIPYNSNHPPQHKYAAVKFLYNRLNTYDLQDKEYKHEINMIHNILYNNSFPIKPHKPRTPPPEQPTPPPKQQKWATFTYVGKETSYITNLFRHSNLKIAYRTNNTVLNHLTHKYKNPNIFSSSGVYKLTCPDCKKAYVGQTGRNFTTRYNEHKHAFRTNSHSSRFAKHLYEHSHSFDTIENSMQVLHHHKKGAHLNTLERFYIHAEYTTNNHLNDSHTILPNKIFDTLLKTHQP